jgi:hypothetical protein
MKKVCCKSKCFSRLVYVRRIVKHVSVLKLLIRFGSKQYAFALLKNHFVKNEAVKALSQT